MDISVERERERQQQRNADRLRELAMKNRVREDIERKRTVDPRERVLERGILPEKGVDRERLQERPVIMERPMLGERDPKIAVPLGRLLDRDARTVERDVLRDAPHVGRASSLERMRGYASRERDDERTTERIRESDRDAVGMDRVVDRDAEREESLRELVSNYTSALAELTFNSKPIITNLTIIAGENSHAAKGISSTVFNHILEVPKEQKLPSLYLLDSIVKNIGGEYIKYFAERLPEVFCLAYRQVDPSTNPAMQHLFRTWRGVFPPGPLRLIESELDISVSAPNGPSASTPPARPAEVPIPRTSHDPPMPRTGHGIHVNPKYLEAQRQRLQQTGQAESVPPGSNGSAVVRGTEGPNLREGSKGWSDSQLKRPPVPSRSKRDEYADAGFDFEYDDYGLSNGPNNVRKPAPRRVVDRDEAWEPGYFRDGDGEGFGHEEGRSPRTRYGQRNGFDWRPPASRNTDIDGYGYNRGPGQGRGSPFQPGQGPPEGSEAIGRGSADNWLKTEEEEYVWEDMSPRLRPPQGRDDERLNDGLSSKDNWYPGEQDRGIPITETGRLKRTSQDAGFADNSNWRRNGPGVPMDQARSGGDRRPPKRQQIHQIPSPPTQLSDHQALQQQLPPLGSSQHQNQHSHLQLQHEQSSHLHLGRHQMQVPTQLQSSQPLPPAPLTQSLQSQVIPPLLQSGQPLQHLSPQHGQSVPQGSQIPALQQPQQLTSLHQGQQVPLHQQHLSQTQLQQQVQLPVPLLPLISSQLAQSLQQLAQQSAQQSQAMAPQQQPQTSQALGILTQALAPANGPAPGLVQVSEGQSSNNNLLAAFLQSASARVSSTSLQSNPPQPPFQGQPPLPSGPPPPQFSNSMGTIPAVQVGVPGQMNPAIASTLSQLTTFAVQPPRYTQPPLPPGPPPASTIVGSGATSQSAPSGGVLSSSISSLLSSLVAHGVIAPLQKPSILAAQSLPIPVVGLQPNVNAGFAPMINLPPTSMLPSTSVAPVPVSMALVSTSLATSLSPPQASNLDAPPSPRKPKKDPVGVEFKQELLRERHEYVLEALYSDFPRQCKTCGLRFKAQDEHSKHMDWHVSRNRRQKSQKKVSRKWFVSAKEWLSGTVAAASEFAPSFFAEEPGIQEENNELVAVPADENQSACALCGELFEDFYSDETDEWMYKGAVYLNVLQGGNPEGLESSALGPIVHLKCKTESAETTTVDSVEDDDEVQPELQAADSVRMEVDGMGEDNIMPLLTENFDMSDIKEEQEELGSRRKRTRY